MDLLDTHVPCPVTQIAAVRGALPPHRYPQDVITHAFADLVGAAGPNRALLKRVHASACIDTRNLVIPLEDYPRLSGFGEANDLWITAGVDLGEQAVRGALEIAGIAPEDVDLLVVTSVTGMAAPSVDARLVPRLGLRSDVRRLPLFGLGCVAGASGIARLHDFLLGRPGGVAVLLAVELCSLTVQRATAPSRTWWPADCSVTASPRWWPAPSGPPAGQDGPVQPFRPAVAGCIQTANASWDGTSAAAASRSCCRRVSPMSSAVLGDDVRGSWPTMS